MSIAIKTRERSFGVSEQWRIEDYASSREIVRLVTEIEIMREES